MKKHMKSGLTYLLVQANRLLRRLSPPGLKQLVATDRGVHVGDPIRFGYIVRTEVSVTALEQALVRWIIQNDIYANGYRYWIQRELCGKDRVMVQLYMLDQKQFARRPAHFAT